MSNHNAPLELKSFNLLAILCTVQSHKMLWSGFVGRNPRLDTWLKSLTLIDVGDCLEHELPNYLTLQNGAHTPCSWSIDWHNLQDKSWIKGVWIPQGKIHLSLSLPLSWSLHTGKLGPCLLRSLTRHGKGSFKQLSWPVCDIIRDYHSAQGYPLYCGLLPLQPSHSVGVLAKGWWSSRSSSTFFLYNVWGTEL